ncbi:protein kinase domain-containing protein [Nostoc sp. ChiVER01]|uniref:protein kinase domain-containing protein n=1 Tax=Nostoc sp. ChiVER01 TaxID=3075382 RepID=UPI002AD39865|nr:metallophosphoesterase [Nostoc sp. ChiVER01]MDZ8226504.1 metallophosphoesterase [Nostoc sp. ChiVER01]
MSNPDDLTEIINRITARIHTEADIEILRRLLIANEPQVLMKLGKYNVNIGEGKAITIGDRTYQRFDVEAIERLVREILSAKSTNLINVLHLSDLHFGTTDNARTWYAQLAEDLRYELGCSRLDALIISGDIASKSTPDEYAAAQLFINRLSQEFNLESQKIVIVPGNHDVNWQLAEAAYSRINTEYSQEGIEEYLTDENGEFIEGLDKEQYKQRFINFSRFYEVIKGELYPLEYNQQYSLQHLPEQNLLILGLNSAWQIDHRRNKYRASINSEALSNALSLIRRNLAYEDCLKIAVWHHSLNSIFGDRITDSGVMERLANAGFRLVLHGGIHRNENNSYRYEYSTSGQQINIIGAGVFGASLQESGSGYPWEYNFLKIEASKVTVETRRRDGANEVWKPDTRWVKEAGNKPLPSYEIFWNNILSDNSDSIDTIVTNPPDTLSIGELIKGRYRIIKVLSDQDNNNFALYPPEFEKLINQFLIKDEALPGEPIAIFKQFTSKNRTILLNKDTSIWQNAKLQFENQAIILGKIGDHSNLPQLLDYFEFQEAFYLVCEHIDGHTLQQELQKSGLLNEVNIIDFLQDFLPILEYIHGQQVIHKNINPTQIVRRNQDRSLCLIDFGIASLLTSNQSIFISGTPGFAAPEQMAGRSVYASDIYALGVTCIYLLTGKLPRQFEYDAVSGEMLWLYEVNISNELAEILQKMIAVKVRERYQSATEVLQAIRQLTNYDQIITLSPEFESKFIAYNLLQNISSDSLIIGGELEVAICLTLLKDNNTTYILEISHNEVTGNELNIFLTAPGFQFNSDNATSLPLDLDTANITQSATFNLTALRSGRTKIKAELYCGETYKTTLETEVEVTAFEGTELRPLIAARSRPVPQPDIILQARTTWNADISACTFNYHIDSYQPRLLFADDVDYNSQSLSATWVERSHSLLKATLEEAASSLREDFRSRLVSLGQYLFQSLLPEELQNTFRTIASFNQPFTLLILADQDAWFPWELLHDGQKFLGDRFIIGRWLWELEKARPYEFPVGAVNVAHYASVEQAELWTELLHSSGAPPPISMQAGIFNDITLFESIRGLHLIRYGQSVDTTNRQDAPVRVNSSSDIQDIEREVQPAKLSLRRNHPLVSLSYLNAGQAELTALEQTWAFTFVRAGCSAFIGSLWAVQPNVEAAFVSAFYNSIWAGQTLGVAFQTARRLAKTVVPESLDWLAYVLFGDPMARPYRPVQGQGYAVVEPIGQEIDDPVSPGSTVRFRVSLRRTPPVWYENRLMEVAEDLSFDDLRVFIVTSGLQVTPGDSILMTRTATGDYLGWFTLTAPAEMESRSVLVQVYFENGIEPVHNLRFSLKVGEQL